VEALLGEVTSPVPAVTRRAPRGTLTPNSRNHTPPVAAPGLWRSARPAGPHGAG
jgi:hypothetical protein